MREVPGSTPGRALGSFYLRQNFVETPGIEPGASRMRSERSTTELHPQDTLNVWYKSELFLSHQQGWPSGLRREI